MKDQLTLDMQQIEKADSGFNPLDAFVMQSALIMATCLVLPSAETLWVRTDKG